MKQKIYILLLLFLCAGLAACASTQDTPTAKEDGMKTEAASSERVETEEASPEGAAGEAEAIEEENSAQGLTGLTALDAEAVANAFSISGLANGRIVFGDYSHNEDETESWRDYNVYDLETGAVMQAGSVPSPALNSDDTVVLGGKFYFYYNQWIQTGELNEGYMKNRLYCLDTEEPSLTLLAEDVTYQWLVYIDMAGSSLVSYKGQVQDGVGSTYLDVYDLAAEEPEFVTLVEKTYDYAAEVRDCIYQFCICQDTIYLINCREEGALESWTEDGEEYYSFDGEYTYTIERYNMAGELLGVIALDEATTRILEENRVLDFEVFGTCGYLDNYDSQGIVFDLSGDVTVPVFQFSEEFPGVDIVYPPVDTEPEEVLLFSRELCRLWKLEVETQAVYELELPEETLRAVWADGAGNVLIRTGDSLYYGPVSELAVLERVN